MVRPSIGKVGIILQAVSTELYDSMSLAQLETLMNKHKTLTLLYSAKDEQHNHAIIIQELPRSS